MEISKHPDFQLPSICKLLGVKVNEEFTFHGGKTKFRINSKGQREYLYLLENIWELADCEVDLANIIQNPDEIVLCPQFSEDEIEKLKALKVLEFDWLSKDEDGMCCAYAQRPEKYIGVWDAEGQYFKLPKSDFPQIKWSDAEPFFIAEALK